MKYIKKPIPIDAVKIVAPWTFGENEQWAKDAANRGDVIFWKTEYDVKSLEGYVHGKYGSYLVRGVRGELYVCDAEIFEETYEAVIE